ncbi:FixH family protein [Virgibacillus salexigens]|uniref:FixH family protein n=1 Tax=Virgibacillus salexigens TaxID=61016 RepID=UPI003081BFAF
MVKKVSMFLFFCSLLVLAACGETNEDGPQAAEDEEVKSLDVAFDVPETADVGESVTLEATVLYGDEPVKDAEEVIFEVWEKGNKEDSSKDLKSTNNQGGTYTVETTFDQDGVYEMYAHTTAKDLHTMPKKSITIGEVNKQEAADEHHSAEHEHGAHTEGFHMHFNQPKDVMVDQETAMTVHLQMNDKPLEQATVRYEVWKEGEEKHHWVDTEETNAGEYTGKHSFSEKGTNYVIVHVENDDGLHEHEEHVVEVTE